MTTAKQTLALGALALAFSLVGCGGNATLPPPSEHQDMAPQGAGEDRGTQKVTIRTDPDWVVYFQDGNGPWTKLVSSGNQVFKGVVKDPQGRYGIAEGIPFYDTSHIYQLTTGEATDVDLRGGQPFIKRTISGNILGLNATTQELKVAGRSAQQRFYGTTYSHDSVMPSDFFAQVYPKDEFKHQDDALGASKFFIRRGLTGNTRINLNVNGPDFAPTQTYSINTAGLSAPVTGAGAVVRLNGLGYADVPIRTQPGLVTFNGPMTSSLTNPNDGLAIALVSWDNATSTARLARYVVNQPTTTIPTTDFPPMLTAQIGADASGWKVDFTSNPAYKVYAFTITGNHSTVVKLSQGWVQSGGVTTYKCPPLGNIQAFKKSFVGEERNLTFNASHTDYPFIKELQGADGSHALPEVSATGSGPILDQLRLTIYDKI